MATSEEIQSIYDQASGTSVWYDLGIKGVMITESVKDVADKAGAHWLVTDMAAYGQFMPFILWKLTVKDSEAVLEAFDGNSDKACTTQKYEYTDFPEGEWKFYMVDGVIMTPGDY